VIKRRWRCREERCDARTWTRRSDHVDAQVVLTRRAGAEACRPVGEDARPVSVVADEVGVCWWTAMNAVIEHGAPLVDDPARVGMVTQLGVDETSFLKANRKHSTIYATGLVDLEERIVIDMVEGNTAADLRRWTQGADPAWLAGIEVVATDLAESFRAGLSPHLDHATRVADPFHVVRVANRCLDKVRRRTQNETLGHRGRKADPLYRIRKLLLSGSERLDERGSDRLLLGLRVGDPHDEVLGAWLAKESVRDVYLTDDPDDAANGPTEGLNLCVKKVKRCGHGFRSFDNYRLRVLLHTGGVTWPDRPSPPRIRTRAPHSNA
jgi:transposase